MIFNKIQAKLNSLRVALQENLIVFLAMTYVMVKLTCNPLFFRQIELSLPIVDIKLTLLSSSMLFPITYIISDLIASFYGRTLTIFIILTGILCDGIFSGLVSYVSLLPMPHNMSENQFNNTSAVNVIGLQIWGLYAHGVLATIVSNVAEVTIFYKLMSKLDNFFLSTSISVFFILLFHNIITDYPMLNQPDAIKVIFNGLVINMGIMILYSALVSIVLLFNQKLK